MSIGRNEACPCGSGRKYKHCCLAKASSTMVEESTAVAAQRKAQEWLQTRIIKSGLHEIVNDFLGVDLVVANTEDEEERLFSDFLERLDDDDRYVFACALDDWTLHETFHERRGESLRGIDWVLAANELRLSAAQRSFLQAASRTPLHIYEVIAVEAEHGLHLRDVLNPDASSVWVNVIPATPALVAGSMIGARVIECDGQRTLGSGVYPLTPIGVLEILFDTDNLRADDEDENHIPAWLIRDNWVLDQRGSSLDRALPIPAAPFVDDHFDIVDFSALRGLLDGNENVENFGPAHPLWIYTSSEDDQHVHTLQLLLMENGERDNSKLVMSHPDADYADAGRRWLERLAGSCLTYHERIHDASPEYDRFRLPFTIDGELTTETTPQETTIREQLRSRYADWCDTPLGIFEDRTPRAMLDSARDRFRVELLLRSYDEVEELFANHDDRDAVNFDFLRDQLGLLHAD